ncbi:hypothetical protein MD588_11445 [Photobacterium sp. SDRW27]|uniref:hypothetical protein n=1 Tax=Photobacterium obscurum TaxID=2829490 RepID=UPI00224478D2|nr:hypothetical protein [Photobacterium obscurum]MCW8329422.1 hypothetical protein [Photobacterium obscurum]
MEQPSQSLSQSISYLKHCSSQLMTNRAVSPINISAQRIHEIASIEYLELEHASKQVSRIQKDLFRALLALDGDDKTIIKEALTAAIHRLNSELTVPTLDTNRKLDKVACDPALAG